MSDCKFPKRQLMAWLDDQPDKQAERVRSHLEHCPACANEVDRWRQTAQQLRAIVDAGAANAEPLLGLQQIRARIATKKERSLWLRLRQSCAELWLLNRRAMAGVAVAAALGAMSAPALVYWLGSINPSNAGPLVQAVVVESVEVGGSSTALVLGADEGSTTTLIWVEPGDDDAEQSL